MWLHQCVKPTFCRHYSFKSRPWLANGSLCASYKGRFTQLQKWMISVFPSTAAHFVHQQPGTQVEIMGDALEVKPCKPILNYRIATTRWIKSTYYHYLPVKLPYQNTTYFLKISDGHRLYKSPKIKYNNRPLAP